ncbi:hypothetical protein Rt10032_c05g2287 [Rhodotorula toruloides]|uniref:Uncharacterized protein n=1 Tax=Rhodotorula toruloides TaxID=5286 RepID=A0A511KD14_RHOTO|nr:hypothetical protein Rt10032_c05g2287 [Rhodotorula toruloides]
MARATGGKKKSSPSSTKSKSSSSASLNSKKSVTGKSSGKETYQQVSVARALVVTSRPADANGEYCLRASPPSSRRNTQTGQGLNAAKKCSRAGQLTKKSDEDRRMVERFDTTRLACLRSLTPLNSRRWMVPSRFHIPALRCTSYPPSSCHRLSRM